MTFSKQPSSPGRNPRWYPPIRPLAIANWTKCCAIRKKNIRCMASLQQIGRHLLIDSMSLGVVDEASLSRR
ncbi:hypothetical protein ADUPG1_003875, partial [Aduncisulcus paluster]